jgi:uncharacterized membrane protein YfcA
MVAFVVIACVQRTAGCGIGIVALFRENMILGVSVLRPIARAAAAIAQRLSQALWPLAAVDSRQVSTRGWCDRAGNGRTDHLRFAGLDFPPRYLILGGLLSGFFGGLSRNQEALRVAFLIKAGMAKEAFMGTSVVSAVIVDTARLPVYGLSIYRKSVELLPSDMIGIVLAATLAAFVGAYFGARLIGEVTLRGIQLTVAAAMAMIGFCLAIGLI